MVRKILKRIGIAFAGLCTIPVLFTVYVWIASMVNDVHIGTQGAETLRSIFGSEFVIKLETIVYNLEEKWYNWKEDPEDIVINERGLEFLQRSESGEINTLDIEIPERASKPPDFQPVILSPELEGEGVWVPLIDGQDMLYYTKVRSDVDRPGSVTELIAMDLAKLRYDVVVGKGYIEGRNNPEDGEIPDDIKDRLVACFNGGFKPVHDDGGFYIRGEIVKNMVFDKATFCIYHDGTLEIASWTQELHNRIYSSDIPLWSALQNQPILLDDGVINNDVHHWGLIARSMGIREDRGSLHADWENYIGTLSPEEVVRLIGNAAGMSPFGRNLFSQTDTSTPAVEDVHAWRTAIGLTRTGHLIYAAGNRLSAQTLAYALVLAGCYDGMHMDMNIANCGFIYYTRNSDGELVPNTFSDRFPSLKGKYLEGYTHDFICVYAEQPEYISYQSK